MQRIKQGLHLACLLFVLLTYNMQHTAAQDYYRIKANFTVTKLHDSVSRLIKGTVFYDKYIQKTVYKVYFPKPAIQVVKDTLLYLFSPDSLLISQTVIPDVSQYTIFHICLNGQLLHYGLQDSKYQLIDTREQSAKTITVWQHQSGKGGKIALASQHRQLQAAVFLTTKNQWIEKHFFEGYQTISGICFPTKITRIKKGDTTNNYQITTFKNIKLNDEKSDNMYNYPLHQ